MAVHDMGSIRNANWILSHLKTFLHVTTFNREHVYYLNKKGRILLGEEKEVKKTNRLAHCLMRNEAWLCLYCPDDWQPEVSIKYTVNFEKKSIIPDVKFRDEQGILHAVEIDRTQDMRKNEEKLKRYTEFSQLYKRKYGKVPIVHFFTVSAHRQERLEKMAAKHGVYAQVVVIPELV